MGYSDSCTSTIWFYSLNKHSLDLKCLLWTFCVAVVKCFQLSVFSVTTARVVGNRHGDSSLRMRTRCTTGALQHVRSATPAAACVQAFHFNLDRLHSPYSCARCEDDNSALNDATAERLLLTAFSYCFGLFIFYS